MKKLFTLALLVILSVSAFAVEVTTTLDFTDPNSISPCYTSDQNLYDIVTWTSNTDAIPSARVVPIGSMNKYGSISINDVSIKALTLCTNSVVKIQIDSPNYIKKVTIECCNTAANLSTTLGELTSSYSSDFSKKNYVWTPSSNMTMFQASLKVASTLAVISKIEIIYENGEATEIDNINNDNNKNITNSIYDIMGRKMNTYHQGINIINGKKYLISK